MKIRKSLLAALTTCFACVLFLSGCSEPPPPEKSTLEKLNSTDVSEQEQGLNDAEDKYGVKK
jgi:PBP1b-binding outer membrane lipoprotein LpoB